MHDSLLPYAGSPHCISFHVFCDPSVPPPFTGPPCPGMQEISFLAWQGICLGTCFDMARHIPGNAKAYAAPCQGTGLGMPGHIICFGMAMHMPGHAKACALECLGIFFGLARHVPWHVQAYAFSFLGMPVPMRFGTPRLMPTCPAHALACLGICIGMPGHAKHMLWHAKAYAKEPARWFSVSISRLYPISTL